MTLRAVHLIVRNGFAPCDEIGRASSGGRIGGLREDSSYLLAVEDEAEWRLFIDDVPLQKHGELFAWSPCFYAGRVEVTAIDKLGRENAFFLVVEPASTKVTFDQFGAMVDAIRAFDEKLLLGETAACLGFGRKGSGGRLDMLVRWERLKKHGHAFLDCVEVITRIPHSNIKPTAQSISLARVRKLPVTAFRDRRMVALAMGQPTDTDRIETIRIRTQIPVVTVDTPANRAIQSLLKRFAQALVAIKAWIDLTRGELTDTERLAQQARRHAIIRALELRAERLMWSYPFKGVLKVETTAAGLTQVAANPAYARAYRRGTEALRLGTHQHGANEDLRVSPSWGVYETWCFVALAEVLEDRLNVKFALGQSRAAKADVTLVASLLDGRQVELLFQAVFPSERPYRGTLAWSLSRERRPDIAVTVSDEHQTKICLLDAKYRSGRTNVLDAMASAHIYRDSLHLGQQRPDGCLLMLPGIVDVESLERQETWRRYGAGTVSGFSIGQDGTYRCATALCEWLGLDDVAKDAHQSTDALDSF